MTLSPSIDPVPPRCRRRMRWRRLAVVAAMAAGLAIPAAQAQSPAPRRLALVLAFGEYANFPPLPICLRSADAVGGALRTLGFEVADIRNASNGPASAALGAFAGRVAEASAFSVVYACGYVTGFNGRPFLLPSSASLSRPEDALSQAFLAKTLIDLVRRVATPALVLIDAVDMPGGEPNGLGGLIHADPLRPGLFVAGATTHDPGGTTTRLAAVAAAAIAAPDAAAGGILTALQGALDASTSLATAGAAPEPALLTPKPPAPPPAPTAPAPAAAAPAPAVPAPAPPVTAAPAAPAPPQESAPAAPAGTAPPAAAPELDEAARRRIQTALRQLGLYNGFLDGRFGPGTTLAIKRYQAIRGVEQTGELDADQALQLLGMVKSSP